jgi:hypothetical protein
MMTTIPLHPRRRSRVFRPYWWEIVLGLLAVAVVVFYAFAQHAQKHPRYAFDEQVVMDKCGVPASTDMDSGRAYVQGDLDIYPSRSGGAPITVNRETGDITCYVLVVPIH